MLQYVEQKVEREIDTITHILDELGLEVKYSLNSFDRGVYTYINKQMYYIPNKLFAFHVAAYIKGTIDYKQFRSIWTDV